MLFIESYLCTNVLATFHVLPFSVSVWTVSPQRLLQDVIIAQRDLGASCHKAWLWAPMQHSSALLLCLSSSVLLRDKWRKCLSRLIKPTVNTFFARPIREEEVHMICSPHQLITCWTYRNNEADLQDVDFVDQKHVVLFTVNLKFVLVLLETWVLTVLFSMTYIKH